MLLLLVSPRKLSTPRWRPSAKAPPKLKFRRAAGPELLKGVRRKRRYPSGVLAVFAFSAPSPLKAPA